MQNEQYGMGGTGSFGTDAMGEDTGEPGTLWHPHPRLPGVERLHVNKGFGQHAPMSFMSRISALHMANKVGGNIHTFGNKYHIHRKRAENFTEDFTGGAEGGTEAAGFQAYESGGCSCKCQGCQKRPLKEEYGAGEDASTKMVKNYQKDTPGQEKAEVDYQHTIRTIKKFMKDKYTKK